MITVRAGLTVLVLLAGATVALPPASAVAAAPTPPSAGTPVCGQHDVLDGPSRPPAGAVRVPAGNNVNLTLQPNTTYWFAPGTHTLGAGRYAQFQPKDGDRFVGAPGAVLDGRHKNAYAFTMHATDVVIEHLTITNFGAPGDNNNEGVVNHDAGHDWTIRFNTIAGNAGAGVFVGSGDNVQQNCLSLNGQYGLSAYEPDGVDDVTITGNEIVGNNVDDWEHRIPGCGCTGGAKFWDTDGADVTANWVHDNRGPGLWADTNNNDFDFSDNYLDHNDGEGIFYEISYNARIQANTFVANAIAYGRDNPGFPTGAIYLSESGGDSRVPARWDTIAISDNRFVDNWSGVVLWENADRFCNSPANSSSGYCTLVNPDVTLQTCVRGTIKNEPYYSDCRWKTQHVRVTDNRFQLDAGHIDGCTQANSCGQQGMFSNYGTYPNWSPYRGTKIDTAIALHQDDVFANNTYAGPWSFMVRAQGTVVTFAQWRAAPYRQDAGSTLTP